ncbi:MAG: hypothetical protein HYZ11_06120 [Candidatus Tectomicrobia bacterium]|uniref:Uncharacterized protein n=1 Tax=Tectimicrobiota bacterium TaxID=2528274 RepID=A0A932HZG6_UNCTE|nr:hypothetical protein [Candidatus Tectomicrobia bacterium]
MPGGVGEADAARIPFDFVSRRWGLFRMLRREMVNEDFRAQLREWRVQRALWILLILILISALAGAFGGGPLSRAVAGDAAESFWLEYERFGRYKSTSLLKVHAGERTGRTIALRLSNDYLDQIEIERITPEPAWTETFSTHTAFHFAAGAGSTLLATIQFRPKRIGRIHGAAGAGGASLPFAHWVYP